MKPARTWHAGHMLFALASYFNWWQQKLVTECEIGGRREDLVVVSRAGYATVVEIKVSRADWLKDQHKGRWSTPSPHVARFFYAVPQPVYKQGIPDHVPEIAGILVVRDRNTWQGHDSAHEARAAARLKAEKLPAERLAQIDAAFYYRFWRQQMDQLRGRLYDAPARKALAA